MVKNLLVLGLLVLSLVAGRASFREMTYGAGPRDSAGERPGEGQEVAFVSNSLDGTVSVIDMATLAVVATIDVTPDGKRVGPARDLAQWLAQDYLEGKVGLNYAQDTDLSRDGAVLFVSRGYLGDVAAFEIATGTLLWRSPVAGFRADHMAISPDGKRLYVSTLIYSRNRVKVLDTRTGDSLGDLTAGRWPHDIHLSPGGERVYVASLGDMRETVAVRRQADDAYRITIADTSDLRVIGYIDFDAGVRPFAIGHDKRRVYAQLSDLHGVEARDLDSGRLLERLQLPVADGVTRADWDFEAPHHGLALTPDEGLLCLAGRASDYAAIVTTDPLELQVTVPTGDAPGWAALDSSGDRCLLPNTRSNDVSIVSLSQGRELTRIKVGRAPKHITVGSVAAGLLDKL